MEDYVPPSNRQLPRPNTAVRHKAVLEVLTEDELVEIDKLVAELDEDYVGDILDANGGNVVTHSGVPFYASINRSRRGNYTLRLHMMSYRELLTGDCFYMQCGPSVYKAFATLKTIAKSNETWFDKTTNNLVVGGAARAREKQKFWADFTNPYETCCICMDFCCRTDNKMPCCEARVCAICVFKIESCPLCRAKLGDDDSQTFHIEVVVGSEGDDEDDSYGDGGGAGAQNVAAVAAAAPLNARRARDRSHSVNSEEQIRINLQSRFL